MRQDFSREKHAAQQRSMTNKRLAFTIFAFLLTIFLAFSSLFYFPAYTIKPSHTRVATQDIVIANADEDKNTSGLSNYLRRLIGQRGYLRAGQSVSANYSLPAGTQMDLIISSCAKFVIIEIYQCNKTELQRVGVGQLQDGRFDFIVNTNGFYLFDQVVTNSLNSSPEYKVSWRRNLPQG